MYTNQKKIYQLIALLLFSFSLGALSLGAQGDDGNQVDDYVDGQEEIDFGDDDEGIDYSDFPNYESPDDIAVKFFTTSGISEKLFIRRGKEFKRIEPSFQSVGQSHYYDNSNQFVFYRETVNEEGEMIYLPAGRCDIPSGTKDIIIAINKKGKEYRLFCIDMSLRAHEIGTARFVNLSTGNLFVLLDKKRAGIAPGESIEASFDTNKTKFFNFKIAVKYKEEAKMIFTKRYPFRGKTRRLFIGYLTNSQEGDEGPFRVCSHLDAGPSSRPSLNNE